MTDLEINKAVAEINGYTFTIDGTVVLGMLANVPLPEYCNVANDAWPIILGNRISVFDTGENVYGWAASTSVFDFYSHGDQISHFDKNPLRAAMIVFLKMKEQ
jgi:hypothetical protein